MKKSELTEAERACVFIYEQLRNKVALDDTVFKAKNLGKKLLESLELEVKPVFPTEHCFVLSSHGTKYADYNRRPSHSIVAANSGNTFDTIELAEQEDLRRQAQTRIREKINIANEGKNVFKVGAINYGLYYNYDSNKVLAALSPPSTQWLLSWEYIRTDQAAETLRDDKDFVEDWKLMKGIKV